MFDPNLDEKRNAMLGELDHLNSLIGLAKSFVKNKSIAKLLTDIQDDIFVLQANIASPRNVKYLPENITFGRVLEIQMATYRIEACLKPLSHFIVPEGVTAACLLHCVRTQARRIERTIPGYLKKPSLPAMYLDRIACLMFALARTVNQQYGFCERPPSYVVRRVREEQNTIATKRRKHEQQRRRT